MLKRVATNAAALAIGGAVAQLAFVSIEIVIARQFGRGDYGIFSTVQAIALANLIILDLGMHWWTIESGSRKPQTIAELLGTTVVLKLIGFAVLYPLAAWGLSALGYDKRTVVFFLVFFFYSLTMAMQDSLSAVYTARQRMVVNGVFQGGAPLLIAAFVAVSLALGGGLNAVGASYVAGGMLVTVIWGAMTWRAERPRVRMAASPQILRGSYLYGLTGLLVHVFRKGDILLLSALASMPQVGIYAAGSKLLDLAYKVPMVGALAVSPALFRQDQSDSDLYRRSADYFVRLNTAAGLLLAVTCYHSAEWLIQLLFGAGYNEAALVLRVLSASFALKFLSYALQTVLTTRGQHARRTGALAVSTAVATTGHCLLIPRLGALGAAISVVGAEALLSFLYLRAMKDALLRATFVRRVAAATVSLSIAVAVPAALGMKGPGASSLGLLLCVSTLIATGYIRASELTAIRQKIEARSAGPTEGAP
jgi:O-antigen/teichoic acid export membrane protein